jgi:hypothetical protein
MYTEDQRVAILVLCFFGSQKKDFYPYFVVIMVFTGVIGWIYIGSQDKKMILLTRIFQCANVEMCRCCE